MKYIYRLVRHNLSYISYTLAFEGVKIVGKQEKMGKAPFGSGIPCWSRGVKMRCSLPFSRPGYAPEYQLPILLRDVNNKNKYNQLVILKLSTIYHHKFNYAFIDSPRFLGSCCTQPKLYTSSSLPVVPLNGDGRIWLGNSSKLQILTFVYLIIHLFTQ